MFPLIMGWVGSGRSADGLGWIGSHKMDPWTTLVRIVIMGNNACELFCSIDFLLISGVFFGLRASVC